MEFQSVSKNSLKEWYILRTIGFLFVVGIFSVTFLIVTNNQEELIAKTGIQIIIGMFVIWQAIYAFIFPSMKYKRLKYRICFNLIEKKSGIVFLKKQFVPFVRIQHVEVFRGVLDRMFSMSTLIIYTAGSRVRIHNLDVKQADELVIHVRKLLEDISYGDTNE